MLINKLTSGDRQKIMTICTIDVHARDVVAKMITNKVRLVCYIVLCCVTLCYVVLHCVMLCYSVRAVISLFKLIAKSKVINQSVVLHISVYSYIRSVET